VLDRQIGRVKGRWSKRGRSPLGQMLADTEEGETEVPADELGSVVKLKEFKVQPLTVDEAAEQMELLGHDFYVFLNTATGRLGVVYRRRDGDYGLIDPQMP
jgi:putative sigma-54 modulation protein